MSVTDTDISDAVLPEGWTELDYRAVDTIRVLAADAVQKVGNGHPGTAMSLAPVAYLLFQKVMRHNPGDTHWPGRDRFVLSCGHSSLTLYIQLYLGGFGLELDDIKSLRTWGSKTPGHPEYGHTDGVEITTGPLGQGIANAVGMAMAARRERGLLDPDAPPAPPSSTTDLLLASDGDIEEGVTSEASSLAGTQRLGNLTLIYDHNHISIEDDTNIALSEDTAPATRRTAGTCRRSTGPTTTPRYRENVAELDEALEAARAVTDRPSFISLRTIIGWPAPKLQNTGKAHGSALGEEEVAATKELLGFDPGPDLRGRRRGHRPHPQAGRAGQQAQQEWQQRFRRPGPRPIPTRKALYERLVNDELTPGWEDALPSWAADPKGIATRAASGKVLTALAPKMPELWGGSADLAESNNTTPEGEPSFLPTDRQTKMFPGSPYGRVLHFGIREHAMGAIMNGIKVHGGTRPYGGTFLTFSDYMRAAVRLAALMRLPVIYVWTHDSIGLGEDGPTHQPIEHLAALRGDPRPRRGPAGGRQRDRRRPGQRS